MAILSEFNEEDQSNNQTTTNPSSKPQSQLQKPNNPSQKNVENNDKNQKQEDGKPERLIPNKLNGLDMENYVWGQSLEEINITIPVPEGTKSRSIVVDIKRDTIKIGLKNQEPLIEGEFFQGVKAEDCIWSLEDQKVISVLITKIDRNNWWKSLFKGGPEINMQKVEPAPSRLSELDLETRATIEKMMFDQRQKQMGLPTSDEISGQDMMQKFMKEHPEVDFSGAKNFNKMPPGMMRK